MSPTQTVRFEDVQSPNTNIERSPIRHHADYVIKFRCGCGYVTSEGLAAVEHAEVYGHTLDVQGSVRVRRS